MKKVRTGDTVILLKTFASGERQWKRGTRGKVLRVIEERDQIIVEGVRKTFRHLRRSQQHPRGARIEKEGPIDASNVAVLCPNEGRAAKVGFRFLAEGQKVRYCKRCGENIDIE